MKTMEILNLGDTIDMTGVLRERDLLSKQILQEQETRTLLPYLNRYLEGIGARTAVIEHEYVDSDFLDDFARYYARCFSDYDRKCHRIHFFSIEYSDHITKDFDGFICGKPLEGRDESYFQKSYLGFVIIRPLAASIIGRTCLKFYDDSRLPDGTWRCYKVRRDVRVSFFGRELHVQCMPFLQQDSASAACATCALWSSFTITSDVFGDRHYCPGCITSMAMDHGLSISRCFPNSGLRIPDMAHAVRRIGLDPICRFYNFDGSPDQDKTGDREGELTELLGSIYAYAEARIPLILSGELRDEQNKNRGAHAVAINGYHLGTESRGDLMFDSCKIDKLYVHDDQVGPSAKLVLQDSDFSWLTQWENRTQEDSRKQWSFHVRNLLIPVYPKIRVEYADVKAFAEMAIFALLPKMPRNFESSAIRSLWTRSQAGAEDAFKRVDDMKAVISLAPAFIRSDAEESERRLEVLTNYMLCQPSQCRWDIRLQNSAAFKKDLREDPVLGDDEKLVCLKASYPKYVWNMCLTYGDQPCLRYIIDATDSGQSLLVDDVILYNSDQSDLVPNRVALALLQGVDILRGQARTLSASSDDMVDICGTRLGHAQIWQFVNNPLILAVEQKFRK